MADLLDIFRCKSISEFRSKIGRYKHVGYNRLYDSMLYHKYNRGSVLPSDVEVLVWRTLCPQADRVKQLPLWEVIGDHAPLLIDEQAGIYRRLSTCVTDIVDSRTTEDSWGANDVLFLRERTVLAPLVRLCSIDALTLMLMVIDSMTNHPYFDAYAVRLIRHVTEAFLRLSVFPPFQAVREPFRCHIGADFLTRRREDQVLVTCPSEEEVMQATDDMIEALQIMGKVGLAGPKLGDQVKVVNWYREKISPKEKKALRRKCSAAMSAPVTIDPQEPLWRALKRLRHPCTRSNRPVTLPWKGRCNHDFRIANALGEANVNWTLLPEALRPQ